MTQNPLGPPGPLPDAIGALGAEHVTKATSAELGMLKAGMPGAPAMATETLGSVDGEILNVMGGTVMNVALLGLAGVLVWKGFETMTGNPPQILQDITGIPASPLLP